MDKKADRRQPEFCPQVIPQPYQQFRGGFRAHKILIFQRVELLIHKIWPYHHHQALDLYPDLIAWSSGKGWQAGCGQQLPPSAVSSTRPASLQTTSVGILANCLPSAAASLIPIFRPRLGLAVMIHVEPKKNARTSRALSCSTWNSVRDAAASPHDATFRCWLHAPMPTSSNRAAARSRTRREALKGHQARNSR